MNVTEGRRRGFRKITFLQFQAGSGVNGEITNLVDRGLVRVAPIEVLPLEHAAEAHRMIERGHVIGKLVLKVGELAA